VQPGVSILHAKWVRRLGHYALHLTLASRTSHRLQSIGESRLPIGPISGLCAAAGIGDTTPWYRSLPGIILDKGSDDMIDNRPAARAGAMRHVAVTAVLLTGTLLLAGCFAKPGPPGSKLRIYAADVTGEAKVCEVPKVSPVAGQSIQAAIKVVNDGGWCGVRVHMDGPKPFGAGLLTARPAHGAVTIHMVGDDTRIDYTPDNKFAGDDSFAVQLVPGDATVQVAVSVVAP
jgi:hypothetical protein